MKMENEECIADANIKILTNLIKEQLTYVHLDGVHTTFIFGRQEVSNTTHFTTHVVKLPKGYELCLEEAQRLKFLDALRRAFGGYYTIEIVAECTFHFTLLQNKHSS